MEEQVEKKKSLKALLVTFIILFLLSLGALGYGYVKYKDLDNNYKNINTKYENTSKELKNTKSELEKINKEIEDTEKKEDESYSSQYDYRLKDISCELDGNTCTKILKVKYNGKNHNIKVVQNLKKSKKPIYNQGDEDDSVSVYAYDVTYKVYEDDTLIDSVKKGFYPVAEDESLSMNSINFDGYIYIFNKKYLGFLYRYGGNSGSWGYDLNLYSNGKLVKNVVIDQDANNFGKNGSRLDGIENIKFDGNKMNFWTLVCNKYNKAVNVDLTFDGKEISVKSTGSMKKVLSGGAEVMVCYNVNKGTYKGEF